MDLFGVERIPITFHIHENKEKGEWSFPTGGRLAKMESRSRKDKRTKLYPSSVTRFGENFHRLWHENKVFEQNFRVYLVCGKTLNLLWQKCYEGKFSNCCKWPNIEK